MGLYGDKKDYEELIKENIIKSRLLYGLTDEEKTTVIELLNKKEIIKEKNGLFANFQLKQIDKKIEKIRNNELKKKSQD